MSSTPILLVDSFAQIYRCYHAVRHLSTADGVPTNAVFAMTKFLLKLEKEHPSENGAFVFDKGRPAFPHGTGAGLQGQPGLRCRRNCVSSCR